MGQVVQLRNYNTEIELSFETELTRRQIARALRMAARRIEAYCWEMPDDAVLRGRDGRVLLECYSMPPKALLP